MSSLLAIHPPSPIQQFFEFIAQGNLDAVCQSLSLNNFCLRKMFDWPTTISTKYISVKSTPMCCACYFGHVHIIKYFMSKNLPIYYSLFSSTPSTHYLLYKNKKGKIKTTFPYDFAVGNNQLSVVMLVVETFESFPTDNQFRLFLEKTMIIAVWKGYTDIVAYCLNFKIVIDKIKASTEYLRIAIKQRNPDVAKLIIDAGGIINLSYEEKTSIDNIITPLKMCAMVNDYKTLHNLWMTGNLVIESKYLLLYEAVYYKSVEALWTLLEELGIKCRETPTSDTESDLFYGAIKIARDNSDLECAKVLLDRKINLKDSRDYSKLVKFINQRLDIKIYLGQYVEKKGTKEYYPELFDSM